MSKERHVQITTRGKKQYAHLRCYAPTAKCGICTDLIGRDRFKVGADGTFYHADCAAGYNVNKISLGRVAKGAGSGAAIGATVGSAVPGVGTAVGAGVGAAAGGAAAALKGRKKNPTSGKGMYWIEYFDPDDPKGERIKKWKFNTWDKAKQFHDELCQMWKQWGIDIPIRIKATRGGIDVVSLDNKIDGHVRLEGKGLHEGIHIDLFDSMIEEGMSKEEAYIDGDIFTNTKEGKQEATKFLKDNNIAVAIENSSWDWNENPMTRAEARQKISRLRAGQKIKPPHDWFYRVRPAIRQQYPGRSKEDVDMITAGVWHGYPRQTQIGIIQKMAPSEENPIGWSQQGTYTTKEEAQSVADSFSGEWIEAMKFYHPIRQVWEVYVKRTPSENPIPKLQIYAEEWDWSKRSMIPKRVKHEVIDDRVFLQRYGGGEIMAELVKEGVIISARPPGLIRAVLLVPKPLYPSPIYQELKEEIDRRGYLTRTPTPSENPSKTEARSEAERIRGRGRRARVMKVGKHDYQVFVDGERISRPVAKIKVKRMVKMKVKGKKRVKVGKMPTQIIVQSPEKHDIAVVEVPPLPPAEERAVVEEVAQQVVEGTIKAEEQMLPMQETVDEGTLAREIVDALKRLAPAE